MALQWHPADALAYLAALVAWALAGWLLLANRQERNRIVAAVLFFEGWLILSGALTKLVAGCSDGAAVRRDPTHFLFEPGAPTCDTVLAQATYNTFAEAGYLALMPVAFLYLLLLSQLDTPLVRWLRNRRVRAVLVGLAMAAVAAGVLWYLFNETRFDSPYLKGIGAGWAFVAVWLAVLVVPFFAIVATVHAWRRAPTGTVSRAQAKGFAIAFGTRDMLLLTGLIVYGSVGARVGYDPTFYGAAVVLGYAILMAYAILRWQVFDLDLKIKRAAGHSIAVAAVVIFFFLSSEVIEGVFNVSGNFASITIAAVAAIILWPAQKLAHRIVNKMAPHIQNSADYKVAHAAAVYEASVEAALEQGDISDRERHVLNRLAERLNIAKNDARSIESAARARI